MTKGLPLIFVHVPKAGGTSIRDVLRQHFSADRVYIDVADRPADPTSPMNIDPDGFLERVWRDGYSFMDDKDAVIGHFWIRKYDGLRGRRAVVLRDPVHRLISNYFYWHSIDENHPVRRYMIEASLDIKQFARLPSKRWVYTRLYFRDVDMGAFDVIARYEGIQGRWGAFLKDLGIDPALPMPMSNTTAALNPIYEAKRMEIVSNTDTMAYLRAVLKDDIAFYERYARS